MLTGEELLPATSRLVFRARHDAEATLRKFREIEVEFFHVTCSRAGVCSAVEQFRGQLDGCPSVEKSETCPFRRVTLSPHSGDRARRLSIAARRVARSGSAEISTCSWSA